MEPFLLLLSVIVFLAGLSVGYIFRDLIYRHKKKIVAVALAATILSTGPFIPFPSPVGDDVSGGIIVGDSVIFENNWARLEVSPHTANNIIRQTQYANFTWKLADNTIDIAFRFDNPLSYGKCWLWRNISHDVSIIDYGWVTQNYTIYNITTYEIISEPDTLDFGDVPSIHYINISTTNEDLINLLFRAYVLCGFDSYIQLNPTTAQFIYTYWGVVGHHTEQQYWFDWWDATPQFNHETYNGKEYYYVTNIPVIQGHSYQLKWQYDISLNSDGKWELLGKLSGDTIQYALDNDRYVMIDPWWDSDWNNYRKITVESDYIDASLKNFPLLVVLDNTTGNYAFHGSGDDIRFVSTDNATEFYYEIEKFDNSGLTYCWVNISEVIPSGSDYSFLVYYNNTGASDNQNPDGVWDNTYISVWHLNGTSSIFDSSGNGYTGANSGADQITGRVGYGLDFVSTNSDKIDFGDMAQPADEVLDKFTWSFWCSPDHLDGNQIMGKFLSSPRSYYIMFAYNDGSLRFAGYNAAVADYETTNMGYTANTWQYATITIDYLGVGDIVFCRNDTYDLATDQDVGNITALDDGTNDDTLGYANAYGDFKMDECRISKVIRNQSWIKADFHTQNQTTGFMSFGAEQSAPVEGGQTYQETIRTNNVDYYIYRGGNTTAYGVQLNITGMDEATEYISLLEDNGTWVNYYGDYSGVNFTVSTFDVLKTYMDDATGNTTFNMTENTGMNQTNRTFNLKKVGNGYNYTGWTAQNWTTLAAENKTLSLPAGYFVGLWNETYFAWELFISHFEGVSKNVHRWDVLVTKIDTDKTWVNP